MHDYQYQGGMVIRVIAAGVLAIGALLFSAPSAHADPGCDVPGVKASDVAMCHSACDFIDNGPDLYQGQHNLERHSCANWKATVLREGGQ